MTSHTADLPGLARFARAGLLTCGLGLAVFVTACATPPPPTEQLAISTAAVAHAVAAGAADLAPTEMRASREKLERANAAVKDKDHERALLLAQEAQADAALAEAKSKAIKARKAAETVQEDSKALREEMERKIK